MSSLEFLERAVSLASKEFIRGFIIGQVALLLVLLVLGRFLFFRGPAPAGEIRIDSGVGKSRRGRPEGRDSLERLARRLKEEGAGDAPRKESCLWANALASKLLLAPARDVLDRPDVLQRISALLNARLAPDREGAATTRLGQLEIKEFRIGGQDPLIRWVEAVAENAWELRVEWEEPAELAIESSLIICWPPRQPIALLPFSFSFTIKGLEATLRLELETAAGPPRMALSLLPEQFRLDLDIHSLVGHRSKLKDIPKLTAIIYSRIRQSLHHHILFPNRVHFNADLGAALSAQLAVLVPPTKSPPPADGY